MLMCALENSSEGGGLKPCMQVNLLHSQGVNMAGETKHDLQPSETKTYVEDISKRIRFEKLVLLIINK